MGRTNYFLLAIAIGAICFGFVYKSLKPEISPVPGNGIGDEAPEISLEDPKGKTRTLSDLRGNIVLVDFWASWCKPCRNENPNVVEAYEKYHKADFKDAKGFEIYSVSLDNNVASWEQAIEDDGLEWKFHVSDLKGWSSGPVAAYGVNSIPTNFLLDADGKILAWGLRGLDLHIALDDLLETDE